MGEVAEMLGENPSLIRFWEKEFSCIKPKKNKKGNRLFKPEDVKNLKLIHHLVKERGFTLEGARQKMKDNPESLNQEMEVINRLRNIKMYLLQLKGQL